MIWDLKIIIKRHYLYKINSNEEKISINSRKLDS